MARDLFNTIPLFQMALTTQRLMLIQKPLTLNAPENNKMVQPKKKATVKPKHQAIPQNVIEISPNTVGKQKPEASCSRKFEIKNIRVEHGLVGITEHQEILSGRA